ncbi:anhydro-N-acetylmuramic acid kinase [Sphingobacterium sp. UT-1RO-CII-1]|uniref:anhydro-N-acetylmuramic acid kinase n=1 Tax=Sphingobacterium sp. UT-1RO-CII-1 TaxID=2995225 RepID=UPI00227AA52A|nr:anhydro-N-acetylmuramic acid kinase [Sphingobacterium sp. UT-1RO-CII-1]MCY4778740.1 anhydro-N-acetylmuramic acid kinase [Sphingobacterium sp. UT-1RO-CII-1]
MNPQIQKLHAIANKETRYIIGLMSGTSLDGLDIALCKIKNSGSQTNLSLEEFTTKPYDKSFQEEIKKVFSKDIIHQKSLVSLNSKIGLLHADLINKTLHDWGIPNSSIDLIASHGQTIYHYPKAYSYNNSIHHSTFQIGDGDHIAVNTSIITISDFRQKHTAKGGEGAPLAAYGDFLLFTNKTEERILLNIGGIANYTYLPHLQSIKKAYATDVGPGNTIMNQYMHKHYQIEMDLNAEVAKQGRLHQGLLDELLKTPFLFQNIPKTTGPEIFNLDLLFRAQKQSKTQNLSHQDIMATLNMFSASCISNTIKSEFSNYKNIAIYMSGGGLHNPLLVENIKNILQHNKIYSFEKIGINPDAKEACLFALLANETIAGNPNNVNKIHNSPSVCMGKISLPH